MQLDASNFIIKINFKRNTALQEALAAWAEFTTQLQLCCISRVFTQGKEYRSLVEMGASITTTRAAGGTSCCMSSCTASAQEQASFSKTFCSTAGRIDSSTRTTKMRLRGRMSGFGGSMGTI